MIARPLTHRHLPSQEASRGALDKGDTDTTRFESTPTMLDCPSATQGRIILSSHACNPKGAVSDTLVVRLACLQRR